jgi:hypothetical protein
VGKIYDLAVVSDHFYQASGGSADDRPQVLPFPQVQQNSVTESSNSLL